MSEETKEEQKELYVKPALAALKVIGLLFDVGTLLIRLLVNTIVYDTPHGKVEVVDGRDRL